MKYFYITVAIFLFPNCLFKPGKTELIKSNWSLQTIYGRSFEFRDSKINYIKMGKGPAIILIHGGGTWSYTFRSIIEPLALNFTVFTIDMPGHGYSEIPTDFDFSLNAVNELLVAFADFHNLDKFNLVGNSWGGGWAIRFAELNPNRVQNLVIVDSSGLADSNEYDSSSWKYLSLPFGEIVLFFISFEDIKNSYEKDLFFNRSLVKNSDLEEIYNPFIYSPNLVSQAKYQRNLNWNETGHDLFKLTGATIFWGRHDMYLPLEMAYRYKDLIPESDLIIFEKSGHLPQEEEPELFVKYLTEKLKRKK